MRKTRRCGPALPGVGRPNITRELAQCVRPRAGVRWPPRDVELCTAPESLVRRIGLGADAVMRTPVLVATTFGVGGLTTNTVPRRGAPSDVNPIRATKNSKKTLPAIRHEVFHYHETHLTSTVFPQPVVCTKRGRVRRGHTLGGGLRASGIQIKFVVWRHEVGHKMQAKTNSKRKKQVGTCAKSLQEKRPVNGGQCSTHEKSKRTTSSVASLTLGRRRFSKVLS